MTNDSDFPLISIIILNFNAGDLLSKCVSSIQKSIYKNFEIILVDNHSKDNSHKKCKEQFENITLIENKENLGYCEGNNVGLEHAKGEFIVILNPDTTVEPDWLTELKKAFKKYGDGLYQPKLLSSTNKKIINSTGNMIQLFGIGYSRGKGEIDTGQYDQKILINNPSGACIFTSTKILKKIGYFDPFLFAYHDDQYLGWRASQLGIKSYFVPSSIVYHAESNSFQWNPFKYYLLERNRKYILKIMYSKKTYNKLLPSLILVDIAIFFFYLFKGVIKSKIKADLDILKNKKMISKRYLEIQNNRIIDDKTIIENFQNEVFVPVEVANSTLNRIFNGLLKFLSKFVRRFI